ncbi:cytochrome ubiquinol oxidase subunit I [Aliifodinibius sp. S!AR15-10]|uniref:cytochrome ubiquinol oxidase subunit I n=1 Tax=Aliifodinibius sp. S!AR15-10 TaxID=2950437 RepID=UPI0028645E39|nr:cytochrome ubiquinol oxidase subunit I [Aliifodinibius sp. S!AR15-10]MDR8391634.1 cytochrome ubiquinol oxidase subunit I [Aliifodinibius sp. S!AR15-10]
MEDLLSARLQMAISLGFHIIFACIGMAMPFLMAVAEYKWIKTGKVVYRDLAKAWSKGVAIFFATGAVSGTLLSFELGLLWPTFMEHAGPIFGMPFSWEGTAFFVEAIALGLFLYGWDKLNKWVHWSSGLVVGLSGVASGIFVLAANAWMNSPAGFDWVNGQAINIDPVAAMFNDAWFSQALHMTIAAFVATGFAVAGLHALLLLKHRNSDFHRKAMKIALAIGAVAALLQPLSGDYSAKDVADRQPAKLAAMESHFETKKGAGLVIGGIPDVENREVNYGIEVPGLLSFLAHGSFDAEVTGLEEFPEEEWPPVLITHIAFQVMVGCGMLMALVGLMYLLFEWKWKHLITRRWFLWLVGIMAPLGFIAVEAGWTVTEVGRQPWIIYGIMKTEDALTSMPGLQYPFYLFTGLYLFLSIVLVWLMARQISTLEETYESVSYKR